MQSQNLILGCPVPVKKPKEITSYGGMYIYSSPAKEFTAICISDQYWILDDDKNKKEQVVVSEHQKTFLKKGDTRPVVIFTVPQSAYVVIAKNKNNEHLIFSEDAYRSQSVGLQNSIYKKINLSDLENAENAIIILKKYTDFKKVSVPYVDTKGTRLTQDKLQTLEIEGTGYHNVCYRPETDEVVIDTSFEQGEKRERRVYTFSGFNSV